MPIKILKFGGTSMGSAMAIKQCCEIINETLSKAKVITVVSAVSGVTNELIALAKMAEQSNPFAKVILNLDKLKEKHFVILSELINNNQLNPIWQKIFIPLFKDLEYLLTGINYIKELSEKTQALVSAYGEMLSSWLLHYALEEKGIKSARLSSQDLIRTDSKYLEANVDFKATKIKCKKIVFPLLENNIAPVVTGFYGANKEQEITLLGRGGSDYSASILGMAVSADNIEIWTDVDGVYSADPRLISKTIKWEEMGIDSMAEMAYSGAKVLHPKTITAAVQNKIPVFIKNTFNSSNSGTKIVPLDEKGLKSITLDKDQILIHLTNPSMLEEVGFINSCSQIFVNEKIPIDVCATSEITFTCSVKKSHLTKSLLKALMEIGKVTVYDQVAKICIIGSGITGNPAFLSLVFEILKKSNEESSSIDQQKIYAVSCGSSFNNLTILVERNASEKLYRRLHEYLF